MKKQKPFSRAAGILLPVFSLPSPYGIGTFGKSAYEFIDFLEKAGQSYWQVLPLGPTSYGDSPYQSFSAFAGNPYLVDLELLEIEGLLTEDELSCLSFGDDPGTVDYEALYRSRFSVLKQAYERWVPDEEYQSFQAENRDWLESYALFMALKNHFDGQEWLKWPKEFRLKDTEAIKEIRGKLRDEIAFWQFCQFEFFRQWSRLKKYANGKGIQIIGDIPIYAAMDSADTWSEPEVFFLDSEGNPVEVAGCPPDAFSEDGQLWGNPLYRWEYQSDPNFAWWKRRMRHTAKLYDVVRIDHFRGLESVYAIPAGEPTAKNGVWRKGPGAAFFETLTPQMGNTRLILEDLGFLTEKVHRLRKKTGAPGMKVLQFAFDSREDSDYLPHNYDSNCVVYTGTHDNDTTAGWFRSASRKDIAFARRYLDIRRNSEGCRSMIRLACLSVAALAVIPLQDFLELGSEARINTPSTLGQNWRWRMEKGMLDDGLALDIRSLMKLSGRLPQKIKGGI